MNGPDGAEPDGADRGLPDWLRPLAAGARAISAEELTAFVPPEDDPDLRRAAVLMLFGEAEAGPDLLLTERSHELRSQPGQVAFPGGHIDETDDSPRAAALREAAEETGLDPSGVDVFAVLPDLWLPPANFAVTPVLGWWAQPSPVGVVDPAEVATVLRVPISELLDPEHRTSFRHPSGWVGPGFYIGETKDLVLWGFTAGLISRLFDFVGWTRPWDRTRVAELPSHMLRPSGPRPTGGAAR